MDSRFRGNDGFFCSFFSAFLRAHRVKKQEENLTTVDTEGHGGDFCSILSVCSVAKTIFNAKVQRTPRFAKHFMRRHPRA